MVICVAVSVLVVIVLAVRLLMVAAWKVTFGAVKRSVAAGVVNMPVAFVILDVTKASRTSALPVRNVPPRLSIVALEAEKAVRLFAVIVLVTERVSTARAAVAKLVACIVVAAMTPVLRVLATTVPILR